jgi:hypothetical protein
LRVLLTVALEDGQTGIAAAVVDADDFMAFAAGCEQGQEFAKECG